MPKKIKTSGPKVISSPHTRKHGDNGDNSEAFVPESYYSSGDIGNADRLEARYSDILRYCPSRKSWFMFVGTHWEQDTEQKLIESLAQQVAVGILQEAADAAAWDLKDRADELMKHYKDSLSAHRIHAMIDMASSRIPLRIEPWEFDANPFLLNFKNGTLDLKTNEIRKHKPSDYITRVIPMDYDPGATSKALDAFLNRIFSNSSDLTHYVQKALGYSITGCQDEQVFFFAHGSGWNGKSTLLGAVLDVLGDYAIELDPVAFMINKFSKTGPDEAIASLYNKRIVVSTELNNEQQKLSVALIKRMTGGEAMRFERKYEHGFNFKPTHKLWLCGNHEPTITDTTNSIWLRLKKIPFTTQIREDERIKDLRQMLVNDDGPAIIKWLVEGCNIWQEEGLQEPEEVKQAVAEYRASQDILHDFLTECTIYDVLAHETTQSTYKSYLKWCEENDLHPLGKRTFNSRLSEKGFQQDRGTGNKPIWIGLRLNNDAEGKLL